MTRPNQEQYDIIVVGAGPAGCTLRAYWRCGGRACFSSPARAADPWSRSFLHPPQRFSSASESAVTSTSFRPLGRATTLWCGNALVADGETAMVVVRDRFDAVLLEQARMPESLGRNSRLRNST